MVVVTVVRRGVGRSSRGVVGEVMGGGARPGSTGDEARVEHGEVVLLRPVDGVFVVFVLVVVVVVEIRFVVVKVLRVEVASSCCRPSGYGGWDGSEGGRVPRGPERFDDGFGAVAVFIFFRQGRYWQKVSYATSFTVTF